MIISKEYSKTAASNAVNPKCEFAVAMFQSKEKDIVDCCADSRKTKESGADSPKLIRNIFQEQIIHGGTKTI